MNITTDIITRNVRRLGRSQALGLAALTSLALMASGSVGGVTPLASAQASTTIVGTAIYAPNVSARVAGATVELDKWTGSGSNYKYTGAYTYTSKSGTYAFYNVPNGGWYTVQVLQTLGNCLSIGETFYDGFSAWINTTGANVNAQVNVYYQYRVC
jgi:hypothetical protein